MKRYQIIWTAILTWILLHGGRLDTEHILKYKKSLKETWFKFKMIIIKISHKRNYLNFTNSEITENLAKVSLIFCLFVCLCDLTNELNQISNVVFISVFITSLYVRQHHYLSGHELKQTPRDSAGQRSLACCSWWGHKESNTI